MWNQVDVVWMFPSGTIVAAAVAKTLLHRFRSPQRNKPQTKHEFICSFSLQ